MPKKKVKPKQKEEHEESLPPENDSGSDTLPMVPISSPVNTQTPVQSNVPPQRVRNAQIDCCCSIC